MSDQYTCIISSDSRHVVSSNQVQQAVTIIEESCLLADSVSFKGFEAPQFIDSGQNFSRVFCPYCGKEISEWWSEQMDELYASRFSNLYVNVPCCGITTMIGQLHYSWPCGFAQYEIRIKNLGESISAELLVKLEHLLETTLLLVYQRV